MKWPRLSIATLGVCILILALDLACVRYFPTDERTWLSLFALPAMNILAISHYCNRKDRKLGTPSAFTRAFLPLGLVSVATYIAWCQVRPQRLSWALAAISYRIFWFTLENLSYDTMQRLDPTFTLAWKISKVVQALAATAIVTSIILLPASFGGIVMRQWNRDRTSILTRP